MMKLFDQSTTKPRIVAGYAKQPNVFSIRADSKSLRMALPNRQLEGHPCKRQRLTDSSMFILFWKPDEAHGYLSNWSSHPIRENQERFRTMEHYMMYHKAILMGDNGTALRVLEAKSPYAAKKLGREVKNFDETKWRLARESIVQKGLMLKSMQNLDVKDKLLKTSGKVLAEASPYDKIWGIGLSMTDIKATSQDQWRGENLLGKL